MKFCSLSSFTIIYVLYVISTGKDNLGKQTSTTPFGTTVNKMVKGGLMQNVFLLWLPHIDIYVFSVFSHFLTVAILKRAQILVADVWACCGGRGLGEFNDIDEITAFADYRIPQSLVWLGVLEYSDSLLETLRKSKEDLYSDFTTWSYELILVVPF